MDYSVQASGCGGGDSSDAQCGFHKGRSCTDMVFTVQQVVEKLYEHQQKGFLVFID